MNEKLKLLIDAFDCEIVEMNHYCENCGKSCEEVIPTFNCKEQMKTSNIEKILEEMLIIFRITLSRWFWMS
jgi:hypothetical protein